MGIMNSYARLAATERQLSGRFYERLFAAAPNLRRLFPTDLTALQEYFEAALALVGAIGSLSPSWDASLERHWRRGVRRARGGENCR